MSWFAMLADWSSKQGHVQWLLVAFSFSRSAVLNYNAQSGQHFTKRILLVRGQPVRSREGSVCSAVSDAP